MRAYEPKSVRHLKTEIKNAGSGMLALSILNNKNSLFTQRWHHDVNQKKNTLQFWGVMCSSGGSLLYLLTLPEFFFGALFLLSHSFEELWLGKLNYPVGKYFNTITKDCRHFFGTISAVFIAFVLYCPRYAYISANVRINETISISR